MKRLNLILLVCILTIYACYKENDQLTDQTGSSIENSFSGTNNLIEEFKTFFLDQPEHIQENIGTPIWDCSLEMTSIENHKLLFVPSINVNRKVKNSIVGVKHPNGNWKYRIINKKYYELKYDNSQFSTNKYYYASQINIINRLQDRLDSGCLSQITSRCNDIILCNDNAFIAVIDCNTGEMTIISGAQGCSGGGGSDISTVSIGSTIYWQSGDGDGIGGSDDPWGNDDWNSDEDNGVSLPQDDDNSTGGGTFNPQNICEGSTQIQITDFDLIIEDLTNYISDNNLEGTNIGGGCWTWFSLSALVVPILKLV